MTIEQVKQAIQTVPRANLMFHPTPFHKLENFSSLANVQLYMKREDMSGPSGFSGNKMRKLEYIMGQAMAEGVEYIITYGAYQSNSTMQVATACNICGLKPILFLGDTKAEGIPDVPTGNLLLDRILGAELVFVDKPHPQDSLDLNPLWNKVIAQCEEKVAQLNAEGHKAIFVSVGSAHPFSYVSDVSNFVEIMEQTQAMGVKLDYIYHTNGSCSSLPGLIAGKLLLQSDVTIRSINVRSWQPGQLITKETCLQRTKAIFERLHLPCPSDQDIYAEMHIDENFMYPGYGLPNAPAQAAIRNMAKLEGIMIDPVYTGKGMSGLLSHIETGLVPANSHVAFIHSGGTVSFFGGGRALDGLW